MKRVLWLLAALAAAGAGGCAKNGSEAAYVKIVPSVATRVSGLHFDTGDRIGLRVERAAGVYAENRMMTYDGSTFSGDLLWYKELQEPATLTACHPYFESGLPSGFSVAADQRTGIEASDLLGAVKRDVMPAVAPVSMVFRHLMSQLTILVDNKSSWEVTGITVGGFAPAAEVDFDALTATAREGAAAGDVQAFEVEAGLSYRAVLVPQTADLRVDVTASDGLSRSRTIPAVTLAGGRRYDLRIVVNDVDVELLLSGEIAEWEEGGTIGGGSDPGDGSQTLSYGGATYRTVTVGERVWMAENLRYLPAGTALGDGVWNPAGGESAVAEQGLLYDRPTALAGAAVRAASESVRGICPEGWHVPDDAELAQLVEASCGAEFFVCAGYWISTTGKHSASSRGVLLSASLSESQVVGLAYEEPLCTPSIRTYPAEYGFSLRCVKDL